MPLTASEAVTVRVRFAPAVACTRGGVVSSRRVTSWVEAATWPAPSSTTKVKV